MSVRDPLPRLQRKLSFNRFQRTARFQRKLRSKGVAFFVELLELLRVQGAACAEGASQGLL